MTPEEAIAVFDKMLKRYAWAEDNKSVQAIKIAKECIEKQIAKKALTFSQDDNYKPLYCSSCGIRFLHWSRHCQGCGQKLLNWSEEE